MKWKVKSHNNKNWLSIMEKNKQQPVKIILETKQVCSLSPVSVINNW